MIVQRGSEWHVLSESGEDLGSYATEEEARERLRQIEAAKAAKGDTARIVPSVRRVDYLGPIHTDPTRTDGVLANLDENTGFLRLDARITRTGVFTYGDREGNTWGELRPPHEVFHEDTLRSFEMVVATNDHPPDFVSAENVKDVQIGHVGSDVKRDGEFVRTSILITDSDTIAAIKGGKTQLSCGYTAEVMVRKGVFDGQPYAAIQTNIRGNHVAIVDIGRAGPECKLLVNRGDAFTFMEGRTMRKINIGGKEYEVADEIANTIEAGNKAEDEIARMRADKSQDESALQARLDLVEAELKQRAETESARVDARVRLVQAAREILGQDAKIDGVSDGDLMRQIVIKVQPTLESRLTANKDDSGYLRAAFDAAIDLHKSRAIETQTAMGVLFQTVQAKDELDPVKAYADFINRRKNVTQKDKV